MCECVLWMCTALAASTMIDPTGKPLVRAQRQIDKARGYRPGSWVLVRPFACPHPNSTSIVRTVN